MSLTSRFMIEITSKLASGLDLKTVTSDLAKRYTLDLANGVAAKQANVIWDDQRTLAASAVDSLDLAGGGLVDAFGAAFAPAKLRGIVIYSSPANLNNLTLFGDAAHVPLLNTVATTITLHPGGFFAMQWPALAGVAVTAATGDIVKVTNAAGVNSVTYDIILIGTNA